MLERLLNSDIIWKLETRRKLILLQSKNAMRVGRETIQQLPGYEKNNRQQFCGWKVGTGSFLLDQNYTGVEG